MAPRLHKRATTRVPPATQTKRNKPTFLTDGGAACGGWQAEVPAQPLDSSVRSRKGPFTSREGKKMAALQRRLLMLHLSVR